MWKATQNNSSPASTIITSGGHASTVVFTTEFNKQSDRNQQTWCLHVCRMLSHRSNEGGPFDSLKNVNAVDAINALTMEALVNVTSISGVSVRSCVPRGRNTTVGVITGVDADIPEHDLIKNISLLKKCDLCASLWVLTFVKLVFAGDALPSNVKAGLIRYPVRPLVPRATQCWNCWKLGHVIGVRNTSVTSSLCGGSHEDGSCTTQAAKYVNSYGAHEAKSTVCPRWEKARCIEAYMARDKSTRREATAALRRRHSQHRGRATPHTLSAPSLPPILVDPSPVHFLHR